MSNVHHLRKHVFAICRELGLDDDTRRDLQLEVTGKSSTSKMTVDDMNAVITALRERGWKPHTGAKGEDWIDVKRPDQKKIIAIWGQIAREGHVEPGAAAINRFINNRNFHVKWSAAPTDIRMIGRERASDVIEALKDLARRHQVRLRK